jgi:DNA-directed RNA polymerase specialized sigma24 family protein
MIGDAVARMVSQVSKFNINHPSANPFSYFTQVAHCQVLQLLKKEKRQRDSKTNLRDKIWEEMCLDEGMEFVSGERGSDE